MGSPQGSNAGPHSTRIPISTEVAAGTTQRATSPRSPRRERTHSPFAPLHVGFRLLFGLNSHPIRTVCSAFLSGSRRSRCSVSRPVSASRSPDDVFLFSLGAGWVLCTGTLGGRAVWSAAPCFFPPFSALPSSNSSFLLAGAAPTSGRHLAGRAQRGAAAHRVGEGGSGYPQSYRGALVAKQGSRPGALRRTPACPTGTGGIRA